MDPQWILDKTPNTVKIRTELDSKNIHKLKNVNQSQPTVVVQLLLPFFFFASLPCYSFYDTSWGISSLIIYCRGK